jgi:nicotinamidase/pyrazinamidase
VHCVADTPGADYDAELVTDAVTHHVKKGQGMPAYSLFEGTTDAGEKVSSLLSVHGVTDVDVAGLATDYCVRVGARRDRTRASRARAHRPVAGVAPETSDAALAELAHAGAELVGAAA